MSNLQIMMFGFVICSMLGVLSMAKIARDSKTDAEEFCNNIARTGNFFADPSDCHAYYECIYGNSTYVTGHHRYCPKFHFWNESLLSCIPEDLQFQCQDPCQMGEKKCFASTAGKGPCSSYFLCINATSNHKCCPPGQSFNSATCSCETGESFDESLRADKSFSTNENDVCRNKSGTYLRKHPDKPATYCAYNIPAGLTPATSQFEDQLCNPLNCAPGELFNISECRCTYEKPGMNSENGICHLYFPLDSGVNGRLVRNPSLDSDEKAHGSSLQCFLDETFEVYAPKAATKITWCFFVSFVRNGHVLSDNAGKVEIRLFDKSLRVKIFDMDSTIELHSSLDYNRSSQVCVVIDGTYFSLLLDQVAVDVKTFTGGSVLNIGQSPYKIGGFEGSLHDLLICPWSLNATEIAAHYKGQLINWQPILVRKVNVGKKFALTGSGDNGIVKKFEQGGLLSDLRQDFNNRHFSKLSALRTNNLKILRTGVQSFGAMSIVARSADRINRQVEEPIKGLVVLFGRSVNLKNKTKSGEILADDFYCMSGLIRWQYALVSAKCLEMKHEFEIIEIYAILGLDGQSRTFSALRRVTNIDFHGSWEKGERMFDYALVTFNAPARFSKNIQPFGLAGDLPANLWPNCTNHTTYDRTKDTIDSGNFSRDVKLMYVSSGYYPEFDYAESSRFTKKGDRALLANKDLKIISWKLCDDVMGNISQVSGNYYDQALGDGTKLCTETHIREEKPLQDPLLLAVNYTSPYFEVLIGTHYSSTEDRKYNVWTRSCRCADWILAKISDIEKRQNTGQNSTNPIWLYSNGSLYLIGHDGVQIRI